MEDQQGQLMFAREISSLANDEDFNRVLLIDDLSDTGLTLNKSIEWLKNYGPTKNFIKEITNLNSLDVGTKISAYKLQKDRADVIDFALQIYIEIIKILKVQEIKSTKWGVSDSIAVKTFHELYSKKISISRS